MKYTENYSLKKPEGADPVNIQDFNDNADITDAELKKRVAAAGGDISDTKVAGFTASTASYPVPAAGDTAKVGFGKIKKFFEDIRNWMNGVCLIGQIVNNCVTNRSDLPLSAAQGKALMDLFTQLNSDIGTSGVWIYEKYNNGIYHCYCRASVALKTGSAFVGGYYHESDDISFPVTFIAEPIVNINPSGANLNMVCGQIVTASGLKLYTINGKADPVASSSYCINVVGRWK